MGFLPDVRRILSKLPKQRQTLFFSATMPSDIERLSREILVNPVRVDVAPVSSTAERIEQSVYMVENSEKRRVLERVLRDPAVERAIVFTRTKHGANRLVKELERGEIAAEAIHGNKSQGARQRALDNFRSGRLRVLIATDIAARGIDVDGITHVVNYDLPNIPESYVHRIGRTARAGKAGIAVSLCSREERGYLRDIERLTRLPIRKLDAPEPNADDNRPRAALPPDEPRSGNDRGGRFQGNRGPSRGNDRGPARGPGPARDNRGPAPRQFDDRAAPPRAPGHAPAPQASRFDGDRGPSVRRFDDRGPVRENRGPSSDNRGPAPRRFDGPARAQQGNPNPNLQAPRDNRAAPRGPAQPELYIRRPR
jgi:ATP-dependent RNA helicase RhlE